MKRLMEVIQSLDRETNAVLLEYGVKSAATESPLVTVQSLVYRFVLP